MNISFGILVNGLAPDAAEYSILDFVDGLFACVAALNALVVALASSGYVGFGTGVELDRFLVPDMAPVAAMREPCRPTAV